MARKIDSEEFNKIVFENKETVLVDFYSPSCGPCRVLDGVFAKITDLNIVKVDVTECFDLGEQYKISAVPTLLFFKNGTQTQKKLGTLTETQIREMFGLNDDL